MASKVCCIDFCAVFGVVGIPESLSRATVLGVFSISYFCVRRCRAGFEAVVRGGKAASGEGERDSSGSSSDGRGTTWRCSCQVDEGREGRFRLLPIESSITTGYRRCDGRVRGVGLKSDFSKIACRR